MLGKFALRYAMAALDKNAVKRIRKKMIECGATPEKGKVIALSYGSLFCREGLWKRLLRKPEDIVTLESAILYASDRILESEVPPYDMISWLRQALIYLASFFNLFQGKAEKIELSSESGLFDSYCTDTQKITVTRDGRLRLRLDDQGRIRYRRYDIGEERASALIDIIARYFSRPFLGCLDDAYDDARGWHLAITDEDGKKHLYSDRYRGQEYLTDDGKDLSDIIREYTGIDGLLAFDCNSDKALSIGITCGNESISIADGTIAIEKKDGMREKTMRVKDRELASILLSDYASSLLNGTDNNNAIASIRIGRRLSGMHESSASLSDMAWNAYLDLIKAVLSSTEAFSIMQEKEHDGEGTIVYRVKFSPESKAYSYLGNERYSIGDDVIVPVGDNMDLTRATVVGLMHLDPDDSSLMHDGRPLKIIVSKVLDILPI